MVEMQFKSVLLPEPDGAHHADELAFADIERHVIERARDGFARAVDLADVAHGEQDVAVVGRACVRDACRRGCGNYGHGDSFLFDSVYPHDAALAKTEPSKGLTANLRCCKVSRRRRLRAAKSAESAGTPWPAAARAPRVTLRASEFAMARTKRLLNPSQIHARAVEGEGQRDGGARPIF